MILNNETLKAITFGAVRVEEKKDGLHFYKCTQKQVDAWYAQETALGERAETTTGIRLDFHTNSPWLVLDAAIGNEFDVLINDMPAARIEPDAMKKAGILPKIELGEGEKRVTVIYPSHSVGVLSRVELADGATVVSHQYKERFLFIGDSITQGYTSYFDCNSYAWKVSRHYNADCVINGIGGAYFDERTFDRPDFEPHKVFIAYGTNDFGHNPTKEALRQHMQAFLALVKEHYSNAEVYCISPIFRFDLAKQRKMGEWSECKALIDEEIDRFGFKRIEGYDMVPHLDYFFADAVHPNDIGFAEYARNLIQALEE